MVPSNYTLYQNFLLVRTKISSLIIPTGPTRSDCVYAWKAIHYHRTWSTETNTSPMFEALLVIQLSTVLKRFFKCLTNIPVYHAVRSVLTHCLTIIKILYRGTHLVCISSLVQWSSCTVVPTGLTSEVSYLHPRQCACAWSQSPIKSMIYNHVQRFK